ncbi:hypothetical protein [Rhizobium sp. No.120]
MTTLAFAGRTGAEIATITGHSLKDVRSILDALYLNRDPRLAENAIGKLEKGRILPNEHSSSNRKKGKRLESGWLGNLDSNQD